MSTNQLADNHDHVRSYYAATQNDATGYPELQGDVTCDVCVVGGGSAGMSTAIELAEKGLSVVLLEGVKIGWGASGRNGGQVIGGWNQGFESLEKQYGSGVSDLFWDMSEEGKRIILERIKKYDIDCDFKAGYVSAAIKQRHMDELQDYNEYRSKRGYPHEVINLDQSTIKQHVNSDRYIGCILDMGNGHLHPLNLIKGEARAATQLGVSIYEMSPVNRIDYGSEVRLHTDKGRVMAKQVALCGNTFLNNLVPKLRSKIMPAGTYIIATEPLEPSVANSLMPSGAAACDMNYVLDYFRMTPDNRMLFGGGVTYSGTDPKSIEGLMLPKLQKVFPQIAQAKIAFQWGGMIDLSVTRVPHVGRVTDNVFYTQGFSGHGVVQTRIAGRILAEVIAGQAGRFDMWNKIKHHDFPGGRLLRMPGLMLGTAWFRLQDYL